MKIKSIYPELLYDGAKLIITFAKGENRAVGKLYESIGGIDPSKDYDISIKQKRKKRSLNANNYYWQLVNEMARAIDSTPAEVHNQNLIDFGVPLIDKDGGLDWKLQKDNDDYMHSETEHLYPTDVTEDRKGKMYRWFYKLKPSHLFDTKEMARLIDGTVQNAKNMDIETKTPDELAELKQKWGCG